MNKLIMPFDIDDERLLQKYKNMKLFGLKLKT